MTNERFNKIVKDELEYCESLLVKKGSEYALTKDRLNFFKKAAT